MVSQRSSIVRHDALLRVALSLENAISLGLKSGEYGFPHLLDFLANSHRLVCRQVIHDDDVTALQPWRKHLLLHRR